MTNAHLPSQKVSKKEARLLIYAKLADALSEYNKGKNFETKLKKASKLFATEVVKANHKQNGSSLSPAKKVSKKKTGTKKVKEAPPRDNK